MITQPAGWRGVRLVLAGLLLVSWGGLRPVVASPDAGRDFMALRQLLKAETPTTADFNDRSTSLRGKPLHLYGRIVGRTTSPQGDSSGVTLMLQVPGVENTVMVLAAEDSPLLCVDQVVQVIAEYLADARPSDPLRARALVAEEDLPAAEQRYHKAQELATRGNPVQPGEAEIPASKALPVAPEVGKGQAAAAPAAELPTQTAPGGTPLPERLQRSPAQTVQAWKQWVNKQYSKLSEAELELIVRSVLYYSALYGVDHRLSFAMIKCESNFNPRCVSHAGATGLTQLMPGTARGLGVDPRNIEQNISGGIRYLANQLRAYEGRSNYEQFALGLASYNAGPNAVKRAGGVPNYPETIRYVKKVGDLFYQLHKSGMP
jgi:soluble lytic murein transglycosylase-like protein